MNKQNWVLCDADESLELEQPFDVDSSTVAGTPDSFAIQWRRLRGGLSDGIDLLKVNNGRLTCCLIPTRGMGIHKVETNAGLTLGWQSPVSGPVHPQYVPLQEPSGLGWLSGFDELLCRCGATNNGAPDFDEQGRLVYPLHGRMANLPARRVEVSITDEGLQIDGVVDECRFHFQKIRLTTRIRLPWNQPTIEINDEMQNLSESDGQLQMLYHVNIGLPLLGPGTELQLPAETLVPRNGDAAEAVGHWGTYSEPTAGVPERVYFARMFADSAGQTSALLKAAGNTQAISLDWNVAQLPCFTQWKNETSASDGYVTGLEPATNYPNPRSFEEQNGRVVSLSPRERYPISVKFFVHESEEEVTRADRRIEEIRDGRETTVHDQPQPGWCAS